MKYPLSASASLAGALLLSACNPAADPMVDMCQKVTKNLVGTIESWGEPAKSDNRRFRTIELAYQSATGENGVAVCKHPIEENNETYRNSPSELTLNGVSIPQRDLIAASFGATKTIAKDTADHTKEKSIELAQQASEKAREMADEAQVLAAEAKVKAEELTAKAEVLAGEAKERAAVLAVEARNKATELASQASELSAVATEKARVAALEATKAVQKQLEQ